MRYCIVVSLAVLFAFSVVGCAIPGETKARFWTEQGRIEGMINSNELRHGHYHPFKAGVVDTKVVSVDTEGVITEHWFVDRGDHNVIYTITMTPRVRQDLSKGIAGPAPPTSSGYVGYNLAVAIPEEDRAGGN